MECDGFKRRVAPRLVVRGIDAEVVADDGIVVFEVDEAVGTRQVVWHDNDVNLVLHVIVHPQPTEHPAHAVVAQAAGHLDEGHDVFLKSRVKAQAIHRLNEHIDALVAELVASACGDDERVVVREILARQLVCHFQKAFSRSFPLAAKRSPFGHKIVFKTIRQHHIGRLVEQLEALAGGDVAHRRETVGIVGRLLLDGMFALNIEFAGHLVAIIGEKIVVERLVVARNAASNGGGVGGENGANLRQMMLDVEQSEARHPFVGVVDEG